MIKKIILLFPLIFLIGSESIKSEDDNKLFGIFVTKKFREPAQLDGGVDIQSKGGYIK